MAYTNRGMRKLLVTLDDDLDLWLTGFTNQNEMTRIALRLYKEDITTGTLISLYRQVKDLQDTLNHQYTLIERSNKILEEFRNKG